MVKPYKNQSMGFTYLGLLLAIVTVGIALAGAGTLWSAERKRERERELLHIGHKFREAIGQYYNRTPGAVKQYPPTLEALLRDDRFPTPRRYLRQIYVDPFTGTQNWGTVAAPSGGIMGVHSLSADTALKTANFRSKDRNFEGKALLGDWIFVYLPDG